MLQLVVLAAVAVIVSSEGSPSAIYMDEILNNSVTKYAEDIIEDSKLDLVELAGKHNYPAESHEVITKDGYILTLHRIPYGRNGKNTSGSKRTVVFLMHGLLSLSTGYMLMGPEKSLAYLLADEGYDVWMGNARGSFYSRRHKRLDPNSNRTYWKFSWDEIGNLDLPASLDYIENVTGQTQLHYIGHSQGTTSFLVLNSLRPEYNKKFISFQGMAPIAYFESSKNALVKVAPYSGLLEPIFFAISTGEVYRDYGYLKWFKKNFCGVPSILRPLCDGEMTSGTSANFNQTLLPMFFGNIPAGSSVRQFVHYAQSMSARAFRRFNHGTVTNLLVYGSTIPPSYNLSLITVPTYLYFAPNDDFAQLGDVKRLASELGNVKDMSQVNSSAFEHIDFIWGRDAKHLVYDKLIFSLSQAGKKFSD